LTSADILRIRGDGGSDADVHTFWCKNFEFVKIYGVSARTEGKRGLGRTFYRQGEGGEVDFSRFCVDVL